MPKVIRQIALSMVSMPSSFAISAASISITEFLRYFRCLDIHYRDKRVRGSLDPEDLCDRQTGGPWRGLDPERESLRYFYRFAVVEYIDRVVAILRERECRCRCRRIPDASARASSPPSSSAIDLLIAPASDSQADRRNNRAFRSYRSLCFRWGQRRRRRTLLKLGPIAPRSFRSGLDLREAWPSYMIGVYMTEEAKCSTGYLPRGVATQEYPQAPTFIHIC
jgi:hypothetical protein